MLAFAMKRPEQKVDMDKQLGHKYDQARWGAGGREMLQHCDMMREKLRPMCSTFQGQEVVRRLRNGWASAAARLATPCKRSPHHPNPLSGHDLRAARPP